MSLVECIPFFIDLRLQRDHIPAHLLYVLHHDLDVCDGLLVLQQQDLRYVLRSQLLHRVVDLLDILMFYGEPLLDELALHFLDSLGQLLMHGMQALLEVFLAICELTGHILFELVLTVLLQLAQLLLGLLGEFL